MIPIDAVKQIDIIPSNMTTIFGSRIGRAAAVVITTKDGSEVLTGNRQNMDRLNMYVAGPLGYQKPAEFYSPKYETDRQRNAPERDLRTTICWNPSVQSDESGLVELEFYSADGSPAYTIHLEGIMNDENSTLIKTYNYEI